MKKRFFALFVSLILAAAFAAGCGNQTETQDPDPDDIILEQDASPAPTAEELAQTYTAAAEIFGEVRMGNLDMDPETTLLQDGQTYYKVTDSRFESSDDLYRYLNQYFTAGLIQKEALIDEPLFTEGKDGYLYIAAAGRDADMLFAGYSMGEPVFAEDSITLDVTAYYADEPYDGEIFTEAPEDPEDFDQETFSFRLVQENDTWKFDSFRSLY